MPAAKTNRCWICGRAPEEVSSSVGHPAEKETEIDRSMARLAESKARFTSMSREWWDNVPDQFRTMDFTFVMNNSAQFRSIKFIDEVEEARKSLADPLRMIADEIRTGAEASMGGVTIPASDVAKRDMVMGEIAKFEKKTGRHVDGGDDQSMPHEFDGLKFGQGIGFLREVGMLSFAVQEKLLEAEKEVEMSKRPTFGVSVAKVNGLPGEVPVCTVCQNLITGLVQA